MAPTLDPAAILRHRGPALVLGAVESFDGHALACTAAETATRRWPAILEGMAQTAGLLAGLQPGGPSNRAVIAEYRDVRVHRTAHAGPVRFVAWVERRVLRFWRCRVDARAADGSLLVEGTVTVAPGE